ncbi:MAG: glycoside hydrolase family 28 protein [Phycisphaerae bacterium]
MSEVHRVVSIADHGARPDTLCTDAIQSAIDTVAGGDGGTVFIPAGRWISGTLHLRSRLTLELHPAAVLQASRDLDDFPEQPSRNFQDQKRFFIVADECEHVTISGGGTLDGSGPAFWDPPAEGRKWKRAKQPRMHPMLEFRRCRHLTLENVRIINSPGWTVHPYCCDDVTIHRVRVENDLYGPNTDGFDINGCRDVNISNCHLSCGDDAIILKATRDARSTERVTISNCVVRSNCIGIGLGQETESDIRQVAVSNCVMYECNRMFTIGIWAGGTVEDVVVSNCVGDTHCEPWLDRPIQLEVKQHVGWDVPLGRIRNVQISNFVATGVGRVLMTAQDGTMLENVVLRDVHLRFTDLEDAEQLSPSDGATGSSQYANRNLEARRQNAAMVVENAENLVIDGFNVTWPAEPKDDVPYAGMWARHIRGGLIDAPLLKPCGGERFVFEDVDVVNRS